MCVFVIFVIVIQLSILPADHSSPVELMSDTLYSDVQKWSVELERPVIVYHGMPIDIECIPPNTNVHAEQNSRLKYTWLDDSGNTVIASRFSRLPGGVLHLSNAVLEDTGFYTCVVEPLTIPDYSTATTARSGPTSTSPVGLPTSLVTVAMTSPLSSLDVTKNYGGLPKYRHSLIVFRMPTISLQYLYVYKVPMCDKDRMTMKMNWFSQQKVAVAKSSDKMLQRFLVRLGSPNCSMVITDEPGGWTSMRSTFVLVAQVTVDGSDVIFRTLICDVECMKLQAVKLLLNVSMLTAERWRDEEKNSKIHEDLILNGEPVFPEFQFDATKFGYAVVVECGYGYRVLGDDRAVCVPCLLGTYYDKLNDTCLPCQKGSYQDKMAKLRCEMCPDGLPTERPGARNVSECYRHLWLRSIPTHYAVFAIFVSIVFVVNLVYVVAKRVRHTASGNSNENHGLTDDSDDQSDHVTHWTMPSVTGWSTPALIAVDSERRSNEVLPLLMGPLTAKR